MNNILEVAKKAGVSPATVSRYINNPSIVSKKKAFLVQKAIDELNYIPDLGARFLKSQKTNIVGFVIPSSYNTFFASLIFGLDKALRSRGMELLVLYFADHDDFKSQTQMLLSLKAKVILFIPDKKSHTFGTISSGTDCYPLQLFSDCHPQFDSVMLDDKAGTEKAINSLLEKGHKKILCIDNNNDVFLNRKQGIIDAYAKHKIELNEDYIIALEKDDNFEKIIKNKINSLKPTALFVVTEISALKVCKILKEMKISIPNDISLVIYDDSLWAEISDYSAISQPLESIIAQILQMIDTRSEIQKLDPLKIKIDPILHLRNSIKEVK